jgi:hypothetical protein
MRTPTTPKFKTIAAQPSFVITNDTVELAITQLGGHMAPVTFFRDTTSPVHPYHISPWQGEDSKEIRGSVLEPLRGDFFCCPFGAGRYRGINYPCHGEPASAKWSLVEGKREAWGVRLRMSLVGKLGNGEYHKHLIVRNGQNVVYSQDKVIGFSGPMNFSHHATLAMPEEQQSVHISTSPFAFDMTFPVAPGRAAAGEYYMLAINQKFSHLNRVPTIFKDPPFVDCSSMPGPRGYRDLFAVFSRPVEGAAWTTAVFENQGFLWFSLKDPRQMPETMFWADNRGRYGPPWNGRNNCLGIEDGCSYLATGPAMSIRPNPVSRTGISTFVRLSCCGRRS